MPTINLKRGKKNPKTGEGDSKKAFEESLGNSGTERYLLRLYVSGSTSRSLRAIANIKKICEEHLHGRYDLEVIDIYQQPQLLKGDQIIAAPTLIRKLPLPLRKFIGDMADQERILFGLDLKRQAAPEKRKRQDSAGKPEYGRQEQE